MKTRNIFLLALTAILGVSCHSWDEPSLESGMTAFGNQYVQETNVVTIDALKTQYKSVINNNSLQQITKPTQIKVIVTGNDDGSNLYKQLYVSDGTAAIYMSIDKSGIFSDAPVGQCLLIELNGLYIGGYGQQPEIGTFYHNEAKDLDQVGRMSRFEWNEHFKLIDPVPGLSAKPVMVSSMKGLNLEKDCGKLITLVGVNMKGADGKITFAPDDGSAQVVGGCVNREINGMSNVVVRTSTYAKFAASPMPVEKINITKENPLTVNDAIALINSYADGASSPNPAIVKGKISKIDGYNANYKSITYWISDDGGTKTQLQVYSGKGIDGADFTAESDLKLGQTVIVKGTLKKYVNKAGAVTPEIDQSSELLSIEDGAGGGEAGGEAKGTGTQDDPFNVAAAVKKCQEAGETATTEIFFVKGIVKEEYTVDSYKNATFDMVDSEGASQKFTAYRVKGADGKGLKEGYKVPKGATVIISGKLVNYKGNTPETAQNSGTLISVNGNAPELAE